jgi:hypothetical protein
VQSSDTVALVALVALLASSPAHAEGPSASEGWTSFVANWTASGRERTLVMGDRSASTFDLAGPFVVTRGDGLSRGFLGQAIGFVAQGALGMGRLVLTDDRGDEIFNDLQGQGFARGQRIRGSITGGTGRYAGLEGEFVFDWQYVIRTDDGSIQGRAVGLTGRYRRVQATSPAPGGGTIQ